MAAQRTISPLAQLIAQLQGQMGSVSGFDPELAAAIQAAQYQKSDLDRMFGSTTEEAKIGYDEAAQELQRQKVQGYEMNEGSFSGNGLLRSGIFATEQGKVGENYQRALTAAAQRRQSAIQQATDARLSGYNQISAGLAGAQGTASRRAAEDAKQRELQQIQTQQQQALLDIQRQGIAQQQGFANQQLEMYRQQMARTGTGQSMPSSGGGGGGGNFFRTMQMPQPSSQAIMRRNAGSSWINTPSVPSRTMRTNFNRSWIGGRYGYP